MRFLALLVGLFFAVSAEAQDTFRVATYNLLNYGNSANTYSYKNQRLGPILQAIKSSITCFNEVSTAQPGMLDTLLGQMPFPSAHGPIHNTVGTTQLDGLFWRLGNFQLLRDTIICSDVRDIVAYVLFWNYPGLATYRDTVKLTVITAHLKSSSSSSDKAERAGETQKIAAYLTAKNLRGNIVMLGDLNLYSSTEQAYQNLTTAQNPYAVKLNDPLNRPGSWDNSASFADIHTQSPRLAALSDGGASGGLDSRFDFLLVSDAVMSGAQGMKYLPGTYTAFGNDGQHYGKALTDPPLNTAVSQTLAQALYEMSDHLPVFADFGFTPLHLLAPAGITGASLKERVTVKNPIGNGIELRMNEPLTYSLFSIEGRLIQEGLLSASSTEINISLSMGIYVLVLRTKDGEQAILRLIRQ